MDYLRPDNQLNPNEVSVQGLAHIGDAVYELMVRTWLCASGTTTAKNLHKKAITYVSAKAQAAAAERILKTLSEEETAVYKRGRNMHSGSIPKCSTHDEYHAATALEALFGFLYIKGNTERLNELFITAVEEN